jgi:hypothetical protein
VAPVRGIKGRSKDGNQCRHCVTTEIYVVETLPHVLRRRNARHNRIRTIIADEFRKKAFEVHEEIPVVADNGSTRRCDIIAIDKKSSKARILKSSN